MPDTIPQLENLGGSIAPIVQGGPKNFNSGTTSFNKEDVMDSLYKGLSNIKPHSQSLVPVSSFSYGDRYKNVIPFTNPEEMYAQQQSGLDQITNGLLKGIGTAGTTFVSGTVGLLNGLGNAVSEGNFSKLFDNETTRAMDSFSKQMENYLPNYYSQKEIDSTWWSPDNLLTPNAIGDKLIKNLGFAAGAWLSGNAWSSMFKNIGLINQLTRAGEAIKAAPVIENIMQTVPKLQRYEALSAELASLSRGVQNAASKTLRNSDRVLTSAMGTFGEASIEALQNMNQFRETAIQDFKSKNFRDPNEAELQEINQYSEKVGNYTWGMNSLLLFGTNYIQFPKILGSSRTLENAARNNILQDASKKFIEQKASRLSKIAKYGFAPSEAFEEGMQTAIQFGTTDYFNRALENKQDVSDFWSSFASATKNVFTEGVDKVLNTKEGMEAIMLGGISGGLQQGITSLFQGKEKQERATNTQIALDALNKTTTSKYLQDLVNYSAISINTQQRRQQAIQANDKLEEKDLEKDYTLSLILPRVKYGKQESLYEELEQYKNQANSPEGFIELQQQGIAKPNETSQDFNQRLESIKDTTKSIVRNYEQLKDKYENVDLTDKKGNLILDANGKPQRKFSSESLDALAYAAAKIENYNERIPELNTSLLKNGINTLGSLQNILELNEENKKGTKEALEQINSLNTVDSVKDDLKQDLADIIELSTRRKSFIDQYNQIVKDPSDFNPNLQKDSNEVIIKQRNEEGKSKTFTAEVGKTYSVKSEALFRDGNTLSLNPKLTILSKTLGGELQVELPNGKTTFMKPTELKDYVLQDEGLDLPEEVNNKVYNILTDALRPYEEDISIDATIEEKINFVNNSNNKTLVDKIQKEVRKATSQDIQNFLANKEQQKQDLERVASDKQLQEQMELEQLELDKRANEGSNNGEKVYEPEAKKSVERYINSTIALTDYWKDDFYDILNKDNTDEEKEKLIDLEIIRQEENFKTLPNEVQRERNFVNSLTPAKAKKYKTLVITPNNAELFGLQDMFKTFNPNGSNNPKDVDNVPIYTIYVVEDADGTLYYVNEKGENTNIPTDPKQKDSKNFESLQDVIVFSTLAKVINDSTIEEKRIRKGEKYDITEHRKQRTYYLSQNTPILTDFSISKGFSIPSPRPVSASELIKNPENIVVPSTNQISVNEEFITVNPGFVYMQTEDDFIPAINKKFDTKEQEQILNSLLQFFRDLTLPKSQRSETYVSNKEFLEGNINISRPKEGKQAYNNQIYTVQTEFGRDIRFRLDGKDISFPIVSLQENLPYLKQWVQNAHFNYSYYYGRRNASFPYVKEDGTFTTANSYVQYIKDKGLLLVQQSKKKVGINDRFGRYTTLNQKAAEPQVVPVLDDVSILANAFNAQFSTQPKEEQKSIENKQTDKKQPPKTGVKKEGYSLASSIQEERMSEEELKDLKQFLKTKLPQFKLELVDELIDTIYKGRKAWGKFEDDLITLYKNAKKGTGYHEAFEAVWVHFVSDKDKQAIISELQKKNGEFFDRLSEKTVTFKEATEQELKEYLADSFADYVQLKPKTFSQKLKSLFDKIVNFFRSFTPGYKKNKSVIDELFDKIYKGDFAKEEIINYTSTQYSILPNVPQRAFKGYVDTLFISYFNQILRSGGDFFDEKTYTSDTYWKKIRHQFADLAKELNEYTGDSNAFETLINKTKDRFQTIGLKFKGDEGNISDEDKSALFQNDKAQLLQKPSVPYQVKFLLQSLFETINEIENNFPAPKFTQEENFINIPFAKAYITIQEAVLNSSNFDIMISKLKNLAEDNNDYTRVLAWLVNDRNLDISNITDNNLKMLISFYKNFNRQRPTPLAIEEYDGELTIRGIDYGSTDQIVKNWTSKLKNSIYNGTNIYFVKDDKGFYKRKDKKLTQPLSNSEEVGKLNFFEFLKNIGVDFPKDVYDKLSPKQRDDFQNHVKKITTYILQKPAKKLDKGALGVSQPLINLAQLLVKSQSESSDTTFINGDGERQQLFIGKNTASFFAETFNEVNNLDELLEKLPYLTKPFAKSSILLKKGGFYFDEEGKRKIKNLIGIGYIENSVGYWGRKIDSSKLEEGQRLTNYLNTGLEGFFEIGNAGTASIAWNMKLPTITDIPKQLTDNDDYIDTLYNYYLDEVETTKTPNPAIKEETNEQLRFFKGYSKNLSKQDFGIKIKQGIERQNANLKKDLLETNQLIQKSETTYELPNLLESATKSFFGGDNEITNKQLDAFLTTLNINSMSAQIEFHKILIGDPYLYKIAESGLDEQKRVKSLLSPANPSLVSEVYNKVFGEHINKDIPIGVPGYVSVKNNITYAVLKDVDNVVSLVNPELDEINEADAQAVHLLTFDTDFRRRHSISSNEQEEWFRYQTAKDRILINEDYPNGEIFDYSDELKKQDLQIVEKYNKVKPKIAVIKPIVRTVNDDFAGNQVLHKMASYPIYYEAVRNTQARDLYLKMFKEGIDYVVFESGAKVGTEQKNEIYENGKFTTKPFSKNSIPWSGYYNQVENVYVEKLQTLGSQVTKLYLQDMYEGGFIINKESEQYINAAEEALEQLTKEKVKQLLEQLGISENNYNPSTLRQFLTDASKNRDVSNQVIEALEDEEYILEGVANYNELINVLMSKLQDNLVSLSVNGAPHVQIASTLWEDYSQGRQLLKKIVNKKTGKATYEKIDAKDIKKGDIIVLASNELNIPTKEKPYMEVMIPAWFRKQLKQSKKLRDYTDEQLIEYINTNAPEILQGIGFRIPTQSMASIAPIRVKSFLPEVYGKTVVVPSEMTKIAGSDFDIDKLNMYLMNTYIDSKGDLKLVPFYGYDQEAKNKLKKDFEEALIGQILDINVAPFNEIEDIEGDSIKEFNEFVTKSYENNYFLNMYNTLGTPDNIEALITPIDPDKNDNSSLINQAADMRRKLGTDRKVELSSLLFPHTIAKTRTALLQAKQWVGIGALAITGHAQAQKYGMTLQIPKLNLLKSDDNTISLGKIYTSTNEGKPIKISTLLTHFLSAFVDAEKNDYITDLIYDKRIVGTVIGMVRMGVKTDVIFNLVNQPSVRQLVQYARNNGYTNLSNPRMLEKFGKYVNPSSKKDRLTSFTEQDLENQFTKEEYDIQYLALQEFLKFYELSQELRNFTTATKWDTSNLKNTLLVYRQTQLWERAKLQEGNIKINDSYFETSRPAYIAKEYKKFIDNTLPLISNIQTQEFQEVANNIYSNYLDDFMTDKELENLSSNITSSILNYLYQSQIDMSFFFETLQTYTGSPAQQLDDLPNNLLIKDYLQGADNNLVYLKTSLTSAFEKDSFVEALLELKESEYNQFYKTIINIGIAQGFGNKYSFLNYIQKDDVKAEINKINFVDSNFETFLDNNLFQKNNWYDNNIVPQLKVKVRKDGNLTNINYGKSNINVKTNSGKLTGLGNTILNIDSEEKIIKIPRLRYSQKKYIDILTGKTFSLQEFKDLREARDPMVNEKLIYEKTHFTTMEDTSIYKLITPFGNKSVSEYSNPNKSSMHTIDVEEKIQDILDNDLLLKMVLDTSIVRMSIKNSAKSLWNKYKDRLLRKNPNMSLQELQEQLNKRGFNKIQQYIKKCYS